MRFRVCLLLMTLSVVPFFHISAQQITKQWEARYSETGYSKETVIKTETDTNGNTFVLGVTNEHDGILLKYDDTGKIVWTFQCGRGVFMERAYDGQRDFVLDSNGNAYLLVEGYIPTTLTTYTVAVIKIDTNGKEMWRKYLTPYGSTQLKLTALSDNSIALYYMAGYNNLSVSRLTATGEILWTTKVADTGTIQAMQTLNGDIVLSRYVGTTRGDRKAYLQVYRTDGTLKWQHEYQYPGEKGTWINGLCYHNNEYIVNYYIDKGDRFNQVFRYNATTGEIVKNFTIYWDGTVGSDSPIDVITVGNDDEIMIVEADDLEVRKYSLAGTLLWKKNFDVEYEYQIMDAVVHSETSSVDVLLRTNKFNVGNTYSITTFLPDKTSRIVASLSAARRDVLPVCFSESGSNLFIAGTFYNGADYKEDLTLTKLTTSNAHAWTTAYNPLNSAKHIPTCMTTDAQGNVYVAGMLSINLYTNVFGVIKYDAAGKQVWAKKISPEGRTGHERSYTMATAIVVTANQEVYITGMIEAGNMGDTRNGEAPRNLYTIKLDANGTTLWTKKAASVTDDDWVGFQLALDGQNNLYVLGFNFNMGTGNQVKMVLLKYDAAGTELWERRFGQYPQYRQLSATAPGAEAPVLKIFQDEAYVLYSGMHAYDAVELRKFSTTGTETLLWQTVSTTEHDHVRARDLYIDATGGLAVAYTYYQEYYQYNWVQYNGQIRLQSLKPTGEKRWEKSWADGSTYVTNITLAPAPDNTLYALAATAEKFHFMRIASNGSELWHQTEELKGYNYHLGRRGFVFTKADGNALFTSSHLIEKYSGHYFIHERDQKTGAIVTNETFDEIYDSYGISVISEQPDRLMGACLSVDRQNLFVTGAIHDKMWGAETIVTLKYRVAAVDDGGDDDDDDNDDDDNDDDDNEDNDDDNEDNDDGSNPVTSIEPGEGQMLKAYPTLTRGVFQISGLTRESTDIEVLDTYGRYLCRFDPTAASFDLTEKPAGVYLIRIQHRGQWYTTKILKE